MYSSSCDNIVSRIKQLVAIGVVVSPSIVRKVRPMSVDPNDESLDELLLAASQLQPMEEKENRQLPMPGNLSFSFSGCTNVTVNVK